MASVTVSAEEQLEDYDEDIDRYQRILHDRAYGADEVEELCPHPWFLSVAGHYRATTPPGQLG